VLDLSGLLQEFSAFLMAAKPPYIKSHSDFIGAVPARFCDARRGTMGMNHSLADFS
jgi:hypothetical protein